MLVVRYIYIVLFLLVSGLVNSQTTPVFNTPVSSGGAVYLSWAAFSGAASYEIYWDINPGVSTSSNVITVPNPGILSYMHTGLSGGVTYYYAIRAIDASSNWTMLGTEISVTPSPLPSAVTGIFDGGIGDGFHHTTSCNVKLDGSASIPNSGSITVYASLDQNFIVWPQNSNASNYDVQVSTDGTNYTTLASATPNLDYTHTPPSMTPTTLYYYRVLANVAGCPMNPSLPVSSRAMAQHSIYNGGNGDGFDHVTSCNVKLNGNSSAPNSASITVYASIDQNLITWPQNSNASNYDVQVSTDGTNYTTLVSATPNLDYIHTTPAMTPTTLYYYRVLANVTGCPMNPSLPVSSAAMAQNFIYNGGNGDGFDHITSCNIKLNGNSSAPNSGSITVYASLDQNFIVWPQDANATSYDVQVSTDGTNYTTLVSATLNLDYAHTPPSMTPTTLYYYRVLANVAGCPMNPSLPVTSAAMAQNFIYDGGNGDGFDHITSCNVKLNGNSSAPNSGSITVYASIDQNFIVWPQDANATSYDVQVSTNGTNYTTLVSATPNLDYTHTPPSMTPTTLYYYRVLANVAGCPMNPSLPVTSAAMAQNFIYDGGNGDGFDHISSCYLKLNGTGVSPNAKPITVYASTDQNLIIWPQEVNTSGYLVEYSATGVPGSFSTLINITGNILEYIHQSPLMTSGQHYYYQVTPLVSGCTFSPSPAVASAAMVQNYIYDGGDGDGFAHETSCTLIKLDQGTVTASSATSNCTNSPITLTASPANSYQWNQNGVPISGANSNTYTATQSGTYSVNTFNIYSCSMASMNVTVQISTPPSAPSFLVSNNGIDCDTVYLSLSTQNTPGIDYYWQGLNSNGQDTSLIAVNPYSAYTSGTYYLAAFDGVCWSSIASSNTVTILSVPTQIVPVSSTDYCVKDVTSWKHIVASDGKVIASINPNGQDLGTISAEVFVRNHGLGVQNRFDGQNEFLNRHYIISPSIQPTTPVAVRLYFSGQELSDLVANSQASPSITDDISGINDLYVIKYDGPTEDGIYDISDAVSVVNILPNLTGSDFSGEYVQITVNSFSEFWITGYSGTPLPVSLTKFDVECQNNEVKIDWTTESERNNAFFILDKTHDLLNYEEVVRINGAGNSINLNNYQYVDDNYSNQSVYYRLTQVDFDGTEQVLGTKSVNCNSNYFVELYPNPASTEFRFSYTNENIQLDEVTFRIVDLNGRVISQISNVSVLDNQIVEKINVAEYTRGLYILEMSNNGLRIHQEKFQIMK